VPKRGKCNFNTKMRTNNIWDFEKYIMGKVFYIALASQRIINFLYIDQDME
jgi:hypothetical protein